MATKQLPSSRRVWQYSSTKGGIENNLKLNSTPLPTPKPNEHLVKIIAVSLNPVDHKPAEVGLIGLFVPKPATPCMDIVGRIERAARDSPLEPGQLVFGGASYSPFAAGGLAEYVAVPAGLVIPVPDGVDPVHAASAPIAGLTAYQTIVPHAAAGDRVFINGGSGGVGLFAIQVAKAVGCHVTTTCSARNVELCRSVGADEVLDYTATDVLAALRARGDRFALVLENVGRDDELYWRCHEFMEPRGKFVVVGRAAGLGSLMFVLKAKLWPGFLGGGKREILMFMAHPDGEHLTQVVKWMQEGKVRAQIDSRFPFEQAPDAFRKLKTQRARGKIIVDVASADT